MPTLSQLAERGRQLGTGRPRVFRRRVKRSVSLEAAEAQAIDAAARRAELPTPQWLREAALEWLRASIPLELRPIRR